MSLLFIYHWLIGKGTFNYNLSVEDSATAEISRSQLWQWLRHKLPIENRPNSFVAYNLLVDELKNEVTKSTKLCKNEAELIYLNIAKSLLIEIITARKPPDFITTYLNDILNSKIGPWLTGKL